MNGKIYWQVRRLSKLPINHLQNTVLMNYYKEPKKIIMSKIINNGTKRVIRERLEIILTEEQSSFDKWKELHKQKTLNQTRQKQIERQFHKRIQSLKIVIYYLTPYYDRDLDEPMFVIKKEKNAV